MIEILTDNENSSKSDSDSKSKSELSGWKVLSSMLRLPIEINPEKLRIVNLQQLREDYMEEHNLIDADDMESIKNEENKNEK